MHYEVELRELTYEADGTGDLRVTDKRWQSVLVFRRDRITAPLTFGSLNEARSFTERDRPGFVRIVRVTEDGEREVVEAEGT
jgi:hypothetical protein